MGSRDSAALEPAQTDRAAGVLLAQACGDALGVPYEFASPPPAGERGRMVGGGLGPYAPGEYSDGTQMAVCIAQVAAAGTDLTTKDALDAVAEGFLSWLHSGATDVGMQTRTVLSRASGGSGRPADRLRHEASALHARTGKSAGNGALMRTAPVALAHLDDLDTMAAAARAVAELTHADPLAGDACVLWCAGIATAVGDGTFAGLRAGLELLPGERRQQWQAWLDEAEGSSPARFNPNGFTVPALQAAYAAIHSTPVSDDEPAAGSFACLHLQRALHAAVRAGDDTDTVAAIAGALLGARWGVSAIPFDWWRVVHGWPAMHARDLVRLSVLSANNGESDPVGWPSVDRVPYCVERRPAVPHPHDEGVLLGTAAVTGKAPDAVVSLCRLGTAEVPAPGVDMGNHLEFRLIDSSSPKVNPNLDFVVDQAARAVVALRDEGRLVLLHCVEAHSRTPTIAARYSTLRGIPVDGALAAARGALPRCSPAPELWEAVKRLGEA